MSGREIYLTDREAGVQAGKKEESTGDCTGEGGGCRDRGDKNDHSRSVSIHMDTDLSLTDY